MTIQFIKQDLTKVVEDIFNVNGYVILHIGNCRGKMNLGLALQIRNKWPQVYNDYKERETDKGLILKDVIETAITETFSIYTLLAQENYGYTGVYINYDVLGECLNKVIELEMLRNSKDVVSRNIYIPKYLGAGLGGGSWDIIYKIIESRLKDFNVFICEL